MIKAKLDTDWTLIDENKIAAVHQYDCIVHGFTVWKTEFSDSKDEDGNFNRWIAWGPFANLVEFLEHINLMDNKIAVEYYNGLFIGFYDGEVTIGTRVHHFSDKPWIRRNIAERYRKYEERRKILPR